MARNTAEQPRVVQVQQAHERPMRLIGDCQPMWIIENRKETAVFAPVKKHRRTIDPEHRPERVYVFAGELGSPRAMEPRISVSD